MATLDSLDLVLQIIAMNGGPDPDNPDDPIAVRITAYTNYEGRTCWGVVFHNEPIDRYQEATEYVRNPRIIWERQSK